MGCQTYLSDIFSLINQLNLSLQGPMTTAFNVWNKIDAFKKKIKVWSIRMGENNYEMFPSFQDFTESSGMNLENVTSDITQHLEGLSEMFDAYYPPEEDVRLGNMWISNPFVNHQQNKLTGSDKEKLIDLSSDLGLKSIFNSMSIAQFWVKVKDEYPTLSKTAI